MLPSNQILIPQTSVDKFGSLVNDMNRVHITSMGTKQYQSWVNITKGTDSLITESTQEFVWWVVDTEVTQNRGKATGFTHAAYHSNRTFHPTEQGVIGESHDYPRTE